MKTIKKLLIANRGEIACRIIHTAKKLNILTIAIYSDADKDALFVKLAHEAYRVGPAASKESYLNIKRILEIAKLAKAEAIHPGYGFLSENPEFAELCKENKIIFIGPSADAIRKMGIKHEAKKLVSTYHVPTIPGYLGEKQDIDTLKTQALKIGLPVLFKASYGGGGKGMRIVYQESDLEESIRAAKTESLKSFDNDILFIEKYLPESRHIEVQIFGDTQGNFVHLYNRDCSLQRRHQKIIEEAPAQNIPPSVQAQLYQAAINAALAVQYVGAGTVEFMLTPDHRFYFMEMNTRLQVEHPVTEMVTGLDLVEWQIKIAAGAPLPLSQEKISCQGVAIEARIYAEDPEEQFLPTTGEIKQIIWPCTDKIIRIDTGYETGNKIQPYYDPLLAKLIVHAKDRKLAFQKLHQALTHTAFIGLKNNIEFLQKLTTHPDIIRDNNALSTHWLTEHLAKLLVINSETVPNEILVLAGLFYYQSMKTNSKKHFAGFRLNRALPAVDLIPMGYINHTSQVLDNYIIKIFDLDENTLEISIRTLKSIEEKTWYISGKIKEQQLIFTLQKHDADKDKLIATVDFFLSDHILSLLWQGKLYAIHLLTEEYYRYHSQQYFTILKSHSHGLGSPMPGIITQIWVKDGEFIQKGDKLIALEAMKMEHIITAPYSGTIEKIYFSVGEQVTQGSELLEIEQST
jgi:3-methylcrotonyl-CoA carboxylase alpha subunit